MTTHAEATTKLGYEDYARIPDDGQRHEIVDGEHFVNPAPNLNHQSISGRLYYQLCTQIERTGLGRVFYAPVDVQLSQHDIVQTDLVVVLARNHAILVPSRVLGTPDLLIEILSPSSEKVDRVHKKNVYERTGVPEFWIVDPEARTVEQYVLVSGKYELQPSAQMLRAKIVPEAAVEVAELWG